MRLYSGELLETEKPVEDVVVDRPAAAVDDLI
jgi:hypothetical protein